MKHAIVHLSDVHFTAASNAIVGRADHIARAVMSVVDSAGSCIVIVSGDLAYSGQRAEYRCASDFLETLAGSLKRHLALCEVEFAIVPGNHDCDFSSDTEARKVLIEAGIEERVGRDDSVAASCTSIQQAFFEFESEFLAIPPREGTARLFWRRVISAGNISISVECYNSAWMSTIPETSARKFLPLDVVAEAPLSELVISVLHHPLTWFRPDNSRRLRTHLERHSDVIMTGHEHESESFEKSSWSGSTVRYVEGAVLHATDDPRSGFNVVLLDDVSKSYSVTALEWDSAAGYYGSRSRTSSQPFHRNALRLQESFQPSFAHDEWLSDPGTAFTHPAKAKLTLHDVLVEPSLRHVSLNDQDAGADASLSSLLDAVKDKGIVVVGGEQAGKTTLCKIVIAHLLESGFLPIYLQGDSLKGCSRTTLHSYVENAFYRQYEVGTFERFKQTDKRLRVLIVDDIDHCRFSRKGQSDLLEEMRTLFGQICMTAGEMFQMEELTRAEDGVGIFLDFDGWEVQELGFAKRQRLIENWCRVGRELEDEGPIREKIRSTAKVINELRGRGLFPSFPIYILTLLQTLESNSELGTVSGAYGHVYEILINSRLSRDISPTRRQAVYAILEALAYRVFSSRCEYLTQADIRTAAEAYCEEYRLNVPLDDLIRILTESLTLERHAGSFRFKYLYVYFYFVAKYFQRALAAGESATAARDEIRLLSKELYVADYANILVFFLYLTEDRQTIRDLLEYSRSIHERIPQCDLNKDVEFLNYKNLKVPVPQLNSKTAGENRLERDRETVEASDEFSGGDVLRVNEAYKVLQVLGQVLRNFTGTLPGITKQEIATECYSLGLRTLMAVLSAVKSRADEFLDDLQEAIREKTPGLTSGEVFDDASAFLFTACLLFTMGIVRKVSDAVGAPELERTYDDVIAAQAEQCDGMLMVDAAIKLDHFDRVDLTALLQLLKTFDGSLVGSALLRTLVRDHLHLFDMPTKLRQQICSAFGLRENNPRYLSPREMGSRRLAASV